MQQASIAYFPEKYVMAGPDSGRRHGRNPVPSFVGQALPIITQDNINDFYPG